MKRQSGMLMHISSLWGDYSIGTFGKNAFEFIDLLVDCGFSLWQVLPFTVTDEYNSPYKSFSAFGGNPYFVDPEILFEKGYISKSDLEACKQNTPYSAEYKRLGTERMALLRKAYKNCGDTAEAEEFISANPRLDAFCKFMTLREQNGSKPWQDWKSDEVTDLETLGMWKFIQYEFFTQWAKIK